MTEFELQSSDGAEIRGEGELIHEHRFEFVLCDDISREFIFDVYGLEGSGFVASIEFKTLCSREESVKFCEDEDSIEDVEKFFYIFDVKERILEVSGLDRDEIAERANVNKRLAKVYETQMFTFLEHVGKQITERGYKDRVQDEKPDSFWGIFKAK